MNVQEKSKRDETKNNYHFARIFHVDNVDKSDHYDAQSMYSELL